MSKKTLRASKPKPPKIKRAEEQVLPCKHTFSDTERIGVGEILTSKMQLFSDVTEQKKSVVKDYDARLKIIDGEIDQLRGQFHDGYVMRDMKVMVHFNRAGDPNSTKIINSPGNKCIVRADTKAFIRNESMSPSDLQAELFAKKKVETAPKEAKPKNGGKKKAMSEEGHLNHPEMPANGETSASTAAKS